MIGGTLGSLFTKQRRYLKPYLGLRFLATVFLKHKDDIGNRKNHELKKKYQTLGVFRKIFELAEKSLRTLHFFSFSDEVVWVRITTSFSLL